MHQLGRPKSASTIDTDRGRIEHHINPVLGRKRVVDLASPNVAEFIAKVERVATAKDPKAYAVERNLQVDNPVHGAKRPKDGKRTRFLSPDELRSLGATLDRVEGEGPTPCSPRQSGSAP